MRPPPADGFPTLETAPGGGDLESVDLGGVGSNSQAAPAAASNQNFSPLPQNTKPVTANFKKYRQLLPRDAIRRIYDPKFIPGQEASLRWEDLVIGVELNGESRAYPVGPLNSREMVNDVVGGVPILVTW